jgi:hypothetical protein
MPLREGYPMCFKSRFVALAIPLLAILCSTHGVFPARPDEARINSENADHYSERRQADGKIDETTFQRYKRLFPDVYRIRLFEAQLTLGRLGYGPGPFEGALDERTKHAIRAYRSDKGLPSDDDIDRNVINLLREDNRKLDKLQLGLPSFSIDLTDWSNQVRAQGSWTIIGKDPGVQLQTSEIRCIKSWGYCSDATATIEGAMGESFFSPQLSVVVTTYPIERWDQNEIVTKPIDRSCVRYTLRLNKNQHSVLGIRSSLKRSGVCSGVEAEDNHLELAGGEQIVLKRYEDRKALKRNLIRASWDEIDEI